jgi:hypothetical protein
MLYLAIDQHRKQLTVNLRDEQGGAAGRLLAVPAALRIRPDMSGSDP